FGYSSIGPDRGVPREVRALCWHDAEALPGGRFQHHPALDPIDDHRPQPLEPADLRLDIVALDIEMDAGLMVHLLHEALRLARAILAADILAVRARRLGRIAQRWAPEPGGGPQVIGAAVDAE